MPFPASIKEFIRGFYYSFPVQLFILHLRRYQVFLVFWFILVSAINGNFMSSFGADALFLAPEYLGEVSGWGMIIVGAAAGIFIMSWNITTFIMHSSQFKFLATTSKPFLKYCINNSIIPLLFLFFYIGKSIYFDIHNELLSWSKVFLLISGLIAGIISAIVTAFLYFFRTEKSMMRTMEPVFRDPKAFAKQFGIGGKHFHEKGLPIKWFFNTKFQLKMPRNVSHYSQEFIDTVFKRHHFTAVISIILAFLFLALIGLLMDEPFFIIPAAAAIFLFFSILIAASGALAYWLRSWGFPVLMLFVLLLNFLFQKEIIDPRNKAYGINYTNREERPVYDRDSIMALCSIDKMEADKQKMIAVLNNWKTHQAKAKPLLYLINVSGGGTRSATFTFNVMQHLDAIMQDNLMKKTFLINGASGGMLGAAYYRELRRLQQEGKPVQPYDPQYAENISKDLLNALFSSFVTRDLFAPAQQFTAGKYKYAKDRGYAFEEQFSRNTDKLLDYPLKSLIADEHAAKIPLMFFNSTITRDGRKMMISTQPISFMMRNWPDPAAGLVTDADAIDFAAMFKKQDPYDLRLLSTLRINATFPYVLPNVWLPSSPIIDVMDAGMRDNFGQESSLRFLNVFKDWIAANTGGVVFIQIRDRKTGEWDDGYEDASITGMFTKPIMTLQYNWMKMQDYYQGEMLEYADNSFPFPFRKITFSYEPPPKQKGAALNFHLTRDEKIDLKMALGSAGNSSAFAAVSALEQEAVLNGKRPE
ncbi:MAG: hypothetical protein J0H29_15915 [Sphingobacteriales bacterium]|nr:hypothetical protein [Sphingobacteriales bacterium]OJY92422.1 MAG: hypothetical protein BGP14_14590 [Sphingobacteriales bacterium 44-15]